MAVKYVERLIRDILVGDTQSIYYTHPSDLLHSPKRSTTLTQTIYSTHPSDLLHSSKRSTTLTSSVLTLVTYVITYQ